VAEISTQWREPVPRYHATLRIDGLPVSRLLPTASGRLQAQVRLHGTGFTPSQRRAELEIRVDGQEVTIAPGLSVRAQASLDGAAIRLPSLQVQSLPLTLEASGALSASRQAMLRYTLTARDLRPLGEVLGLPLQARGQFSGSVQGTFPDLRVQNTLHLQEWSVAAFSGKGLKATLNGTHFPGDPQATLTASLAEVQTPALPASALSLQGKYQASRATLSASLTEGPYARSMLAAQMTLQDGLQVTLERFRVRRGSVSWEIVKPVQFQRDRQGAVTMSQLVLRHGIQTLSVRGSQSAAGVLDVAIQLQRLQLQSVLDVLAPDLPLPAGQGEVDVTVRGTLRQPQITGSVALTALHWQGQEFGALHARFDSVADTLYTEIHWRDQARELLQVAGTIGLSEGYPLALQIRATDVDLTRLKPFSAAILMSAGSAALDLRLTGTLLQPQAYGTLTLRDGALHLAPTGERYTHIAGQLAFAGQRVEIERLQAGSRQGTMQLSGWLASSGWAVSHLDVVLQAEKFTALHTPDIEALVSGIITVRGTPQDLSATGQVKIPRARIKMSGKLWGRPADVEPWELTVAGVYGSGRGDPSAAAGRSATRDPSLPFPFLRADLHIDMPRNVWVQGNGTAVELNGSMRVRKALQEPFILDGSIETIRGFASFYGKKFVLQEGKVVFPGTPEINPFLDVTMTQTIANYAVFIHVGGKVQTPLLTFTSTPDLPQAEIVSLLVLGKTTELLTNSEQSALSSQAQQIVGEVAAGELEKILGRPLGLDTVEIEAESSLGEGRISVGRYITQDIFLSYERQFGSEVGNTVGVEYSINRQLKIKGSGSDIGESAFDVLWRLDY
jgi:translocation and assembly module TamB